MTGTAHFRITYDGPGVQEHQMDVRELAPALLAVGDLLESANRVLYGDKAQIKVNVRASFKTGSFGVDLALVQGLLSQLADLFTSKEASAIANAAQILAALGFIGVAGKNGLLAVIKWLRNRKITKVELREKSALLYVDQEQIEIELTVLALLRDYNTRRELENVVHRPLQGEAIDTFAVGADDSIEVTVTRQESQWFVTPVIEDEQIEDVVFDTTVQIARIEFNEENKWRFTDGVTSFYAQIDDDLFLNRIAKNEAAFAKDDLLKVRVRKRQWLTSEGMKSEYVIQQVLEHRPAARQIRLPLSGLDQGEK